MELLLKLSLCDDNDMTMSTLYRLRITHPVIDAVGLLKNETSTFYDGNCEVFKGMKHHAQFKCYVGLLDKGSDLYNACMKYQYVM